MTQYFVRPRFNLHREVETMVKGKKTKATKLYQEGEKVENLSEVEIKRYQHLLETEAQVKSREPKTTKGTVKE